MSKKYNWDPRYGKSFKIQVLPPLKCDRLVQSSSNHYHYHLDFYLLDKNEILLILLGYGSGYMRI